MKYQKIEDYSLPPYQAKATFTANWAFTSDNKFFFVPKTEQKCIFIKNTESRNAPFSKWSLDFKPIAVTCMTLDDKYIVCVSGEGNTRSGEMPCCVASFDQDSIRGNNGLVQSSEVQPERARAISWPSELGEGGIVKIWALDSSDKYEAFCGIGSMSNAPSKNFILFSNICDNSEKFSFTPNSLSDLAFDSLDHIYFSTDTDGKIEVRSIPPNGVKEEFTPDPKLSKPFRPSKIRTVPGTDEFFVCSYNTLWHKSLFIKESHIPVSLLEPTDSTDCINDFDIEGKVVFATCTYTNRIAVIDLGASRIEYIENIEEPGLVKSCGERLYVIGHRNEHITVFGIP